MRITEIEINNFKAFYGKYNINLTKSGKNVLIYGENGSGKSSVFTALKEFFNSSQNNVDLDKYDNIFIPGTEKKQNYIKIVFREQNRPYSIQTFELSRTGLNTQGTFLEETNKTKAFLDYKKLIKVYDTNLKQLNIFSLIVEDLLADVENPITRNTILDDYNFIKTNIKKHHWSNDYNNAIKRIKDFNSGLENILNEINIKIKPILDKFNYNLNIAFNFPGISYSSRYIHNEDLFLIVNFHNITIQEYHYFLNEARLSAIATSIYLSAVLSYPQILLKHKILFLDDILIGLDSSNRMYLLEILEDKFFDYQIFIGTFDLQWFYMAIQYLDRKKWLSLKFFSEKLNGHNIEIPIILNEYPYIDKAEQYFNKHDYKASSVYIRTAFEELLKKYCDKKGIKVTFKLRQEKLSSEDFWSVVKHYSDASSGTPTKVINLSLETKIELYRSIVMNPFAHNDLAKPQYRLELHNTIQAVKDLQIALGV